jgi:hypothetical protein
MCIQVYSDHQIVEGIPKLYSPPVNRFVFSDIFPVNRRTPKKTGQHMPRKPIGRIKDQLRSIFEVLPGDTLQLIINQRIIPSTNFKNLLTLGL